MCFDVILAAVHNAAALTVWQYRVIDPILRFLDLILGF